AVELLRARGLPRNGEEQEQAAPTRAREPTRAPPAPVSIEDDYFRAAVGVASMAVRGRSSAGGGGPRPEATAAPCDRMPSDGWTCQACAAAAIEASLELKNRKKLEPTSTARPAASATSMTSDDVMPELPSAAGQSSSNITSTGLTSHQIGLVLTRELSTTWL